MTVNTITIVLTVIKSSVHRLVTAMCVNYAPNSLQCTRKDYFNFQVTSECSKNQSIGLNVCMLCTLQKSFRYHVYTAIMN